MLNRDQIKIIKKLVKKEARILRGEKLKPIRLMNSLITAREAYVPEHFLLPFCSCLRRIIDQSHFDKATLPTIAGSLLKKNRRCEAANLAALEQFAARIKKEFGAASAETVLAGEGAALASLYEDPGAFPAAQWAALLKDGTYANGGKVKEMVSPSEVWSKEIELGNAPWRIPEPGLLITLFACHVGDTDAAPIPPMWHHLATALLLWKDRITFKEVLELAVRFGRKEEAEHGLAITVHIFPELEKWADVNQYSIPRWERNYAIPLAARRILIGDRD
jgi:hypothetical protein